MIVEIIETSKQLKAFCARLNKANPRFIAIDCEFLRQSTYWPKLCLMQIALEEGVVLIDPLACPEPIDFSPLTPILENQTIIKVVHAGRQDFEILWKKCGVMPHSVFDTQIAAAIAGLGREPSFDDLAACLFGAKINKDHQYSDWMLRPLSRDQFFYALRDVTYLRLFYTFLQTRLRAMGRLEWVFEETNYLAHEVVKEALDPNLAWRRLNLVNSKKLNYIIKLAKWREEKAQNHNIPRQEIISDEDLIGLAMRPNYLKGPYEKYKDLHPELEDLFDLIKTTSIPNVHPIRYHLPLTPLERTYYRAIKAKTSEIAKKLNLPADLVFSKAEYKLLARGFWQETRLNKGWRQKIFIDRCHLEI